MTALEAALEVLSKTKKPLHYDEITRRILKEKLWETKGKTPAATINAQLAMDIKRNGNASVFRRCDQGVFGLNTEREDEIPKHDRAVKSEDPVLYLHHAPPRGEKLSFTEAAFCILNSTQGDPMHYREITRHALEHKLLDTSGKTPEATMYAQILAEVKRRRGRGENQRFIVLGKGMIALTRWQYKGIAYQVEEANRKARAKLLSSLMELPPENFEELVGRLLATIGFEEVEVTNRSKDGGIDVRGTLVVGDVIRTRLAVQVKRWKRNVQTPIIQQLRGSLGAHEQGLVIATSDFSKGARKEAERHDAVPLGLMNGEQLIALLVENEIGVKRNNFDLIELGESVDSL